MGLVAFFVLPTLGIGATPQRPPRAVATTVRPHDRARRPTAATAAPVKRRSGHLRVRTHRTPTRRRPGRRSTRPSPCQVFNASGIGGLAAKYSGIVSGAGWGVNQTANWQGMAQPSSVIFYNGPAQKANAEALGQLLGITRLVDTAELGIPLAVVLGPGAL